MLSQERSTAFVVKKSTELRSFTLLEAFQSLQPPTNTADEAEFTSLAGLTHQCHAVRGVRVNGILLGAFYQSTRAWPKRQTCEPMMISQTLFFQIGITAQSMPQALAE